MNRNPCFLFQKLFYWMSVPVTMITDDLNLIMLTCYVAVFRLQCSIVGLNNCFEWNATFSLTCLSRSSCYTSDGLFKHKSQTYINVKPLQTTLVMFFSFKYIRKPIYFFTLSGFLIEIVLKQGHSHVLNLTCSPLIHILETIHTIIIWLVCNLLSGIIKLT